MGSKRFIIITVPPPETCREIDRFRKRVSELAGCTAALTYPPHVTLRTGTIVPEENIPKFLSGFRVYATNWEPFEISTERFMFDTYKQDGEIRYFTGYTVKKDNPIHFLNRQLLLYAKYKKSNRTFFLPHLTIAFEDLSPSAYRKLQEYFSQHPGEVPTGFNWQCDNVALYSMVGGMWKPYKIFKCLPTGIRR